MASAIDEAALIKIRDVDAMAELATRAHHDHYGDHHCFLDATFTRPGGEATIVEVGWAASFRASGFKVDVVNMLKLTLCPHPSKESMNSQNSEPKRPS